jgi:hypothetical protein
MDLNLLAASPILKIIGFIATTPLVVLLTWVKFRNGSFSLSQARTQRLYEIMLRDDACSLPSGALVAAVKDALGVELEGDKIRFALRRDNPLIVLRDFKMTLNVVKLGLNGLSCEDARKSCKWTFQDETRFFASVLGISYAVSIGAAVFCKGVYSPLIGGLFAVELVAAPFLVMGAVRADAAHQLTTPGSYRMPASALPDPIDSDALLVSVSNEAGTTQMVQFVG